MLRSRRLPAAALLFLACLAAPPSASAGGDPAAPLVVASFEDPGSLKGVTCGSADIELSEEPAPGTGHSLRWTLQASPRSSWVDLHIETPPDLAKLRVLRFRIRREGERPGALYCRLVTSTEACLEARVRGVGPEWKTLVVELDRMYRKGDFDPAAVFRVEFVVFQCDAGRFFLDDVELAPDPPPPAPPPASPPGKGNGTGTAGAKGNRHEVVADFEDPGSEDFVDAYESSATRVPAGPKEKGSVLAWHVRALKKAAYMEIYGAPRDVREFRTLRFRVRADGPLKAPLDVRLQTTADDVLYTTLNGIGTEWKTVEVRLPDMNTFGEFDPRRVRDVSFVFFDPPDAVLQIDDLELETGAGGWQPTVQETLTRAFCEARVRKVAMIPTKHFDIYTDSTAAQGKFPKALEVAYDFAKKTLATPEMEEKLPIYIFQNPTLYVDFCVRFTGWARAEAEQSAGHGSGRYFATYYQSPEAPTVVHELTHSIFHRTMGPMGGSWFQEGVAVFVEHAWQHQSAAEVFSPNLRSGQFVHLAEFMAIPTLLLDKDTKGGPRTPDRLYLQAGAFYEFLVRGPVAGEAKEVIRVLATTPKAPADEPAFVASLMGRSVEDLEKQWITWGSNPPKGK